MDILDEEFHDWLPPIESEKSKILTFWTKMSSDKIKTSWWSLTIQDYPILNRRI